MGGGLQGYRAWLLQHITAALLVLGFVLLGAGWVAGLPDDFAGWRATVDSAPVEIGLLLFFGALLLHAWVGLRDVVLDYVHPLAVRLVLLVLLALYLVGCYLWLLWILWR
ncbi:MAG TPA: succinate dehydrogenase, hydrophobic membrane anchor protein [Chromatiales bacterium]|nr:succinate dehydrogenase, hydrophobic membrane anchor protein [Chromatiales bacterium]